jgi:signal transduction histidine kinase
VQENVKHLARLTEETARDVQALSHELHSSKLDVLGITAAMKSFCTEFSMQHQVEIEFSASDVPQELSRDISLCLYRVLQESLHNAVKHSGTAHYIVELRGEHDRVELSVKDFGRGFDPQAGAAGPGLGLISMRERVHLVNGTIAIESLPLWGTAIRARIPISELGASRCA